MRAGMKNPVDRTWVESTVVLLEASAAVPATPQPTFPNPSISAVQKQFQAQLSSGSPVLASVKESVAADEQLRRTVLAQLLFDGLAHGYAKGLSIDQIWFYLNVLLQTHRNFIRLVMVHPATTSNRKCIDIFKEQIAECLRTTHITFQPKQIPIMGSYFVQAYVQNVRLIRTLFTKPRTQANTYLRAGVNKPPHVPALQLTREPDPKTAPPPAQPKEETGEKVFANFEMLRDLVAEEVRRAEVQMRAKIEKDFGGLAQRWKTASSTEHNSGAITAPTAAPTATTAAGAGAGRGRK